ncbi:hypothetical protein FR483_n251R [Paramecium bursaria Chlorella virus FR483]|uniref:Uncharacterized protein n251R n=1 Tax=Paramecium bursaria Chlorella virus FR483 TaxID=399781 RepID=A7J6V5_PBCVF|nr:hypothetical protein FR483_n251R [Paramecium bursaria Chlorella virus FR483]ABT15536.1 hypothetical protein FR483_n251R [Paramecium bursaria Chlorella virus FR483]
MMSYDVMVFVAYTVTTFRSSGIAWSTPVSADPSPLNVDAVTLVTLRSSGIEWSTPVRLEPSPMKVDAVTALLTVTSVPVTFPMMSMFPTEGSVACGRPVNIAPLPTKNVA